MLDGRFFRHLCEGMIQGKPRHGEETLAFNSVTKRFQVSWGDDFHTSYAIMFSEGPATEHWIHGHGKIRGRPRHAAVGLEDGV